MVSLIMGSESDLSIMEGAADVLYKLEIPYGKQIISAHRTPIRMFNYGRSVENRGIKVIIAGAGGAAHLPGMIASLTILPVIGVPIGTDSVMSILQMPSGVPVATVGVNNSQNAGYLAAQILALNDLGIRERLKALREDDL